MIKKQREFHGRQNKVTSVMCVSVFSKTAYVCLYKVKKPGGVLRGTPLWFPIYRSLTLPLESHTVNSCHFARLSLAISTVYCSHISDNPGLVLVD